MDYWYLWVIFAVLCVLTVFVLIKASSSSKRHKLDCERETKEIERLRALKDKFISFDKNTASETDAETLLEAVCVVMQVKVQKNEDTETVFSEFSTPCKYVYTLNYIIEDCEAEALSFFFKNNGEPLISLSVDALSAIGEKELSAICCQEFSMYDGNNEDVSFNEKEIEKLDSQFSTIYDRTKILSEIKAYIIANIADFQ